MNAKMIQVLNLYVEVMLEDRLVAKFFDLNSEELLDLKIEVLTKLKNGIPPQDIPEYYQILELYPKDDMDLWD